MYAGSVLWAAQIRIAAGATPAGEAFLGQWSPRTWDFHRHHHRERERFFSRRSVRWTRSLLRGAAARVYDCRFGVELWHQPRAGCRPRKEISSHVADRCLVADETDSPRPRVVAGGAWQHLFLFCRRAAAIQHFYLWARRVAHPLNRGWFSASGDRHRHRPGQLCGGISLGRKNRVRINSSRLYRDDGLGTLPGESGFVVPNRVVAPGGSRLLRGIFHCADQRADSTPARGRQEGRRYRHGELAFFCGHRRRVSCVLRGHTFCPSQPGRNFLLVCDCDAGGDGLCVVATAGFAAAADALDCHAYSVPAGRRRTGERAGARRRVADAESRFDGRRGAAYRVHRSSYPVLDVQRLLRTSACKTVRKDHGCDSHRVGPRSPGNDSFVAAGH